jgi:hypothetical protein
MEDSFRFDTTRTVRMPRILYAAAALGVLALLAIVFQFFVRYSYIQIGHTVIRVDRVTQQTCLVVNGRPDCEARPPSTSPSLSTSTSTSTSLSPGPAHRRH